MNTDKKESEQFSGLFSQIPIDFLWKMNTFFVISLCTISIFRLIRFKIF